MKMQKKMYIVDKSDFLLVFGDMATVHLKP